MSLPLNVATAFSKTDWRFRESSTFIVIYISLLAFFIQQNVFTIKHIVTALFDTVFSQYVHQLGNILTLVLLIEAGGIETI